MMERRRRDRRRPQSASTARSATNVARHPRDLLNLCSDFQRRLIRTIRLHSLGFGASRCEKPTEDVGAPGGGAPSSARAFENRKSITLGRPFLFHL